MFVIVGERINASREKIQQAIVNRNNAYIRSEAKRQEELGANFIDVNAAGRIGHEREDLEWLITTIQEHVSVPLSIDSPDPSVLEMACKLVSRSPMINSISLEKKRYDSMLSFLKGKGYSIVALCMDDTGMPENSKTIIERAGRLVEGLEGAGIKRNNIYLDPMIQTISTSVGNGILAMESIQGITKKYPGVHTICGLSNISYGLPNRKLLNRTFLTLLMASGLDSVILDPLDQKMMSTLLTTQMLLGQDDYCVNYLNAIRGGLIGS